METKRYKISEISETWQTEGRFAGTPVTLIRFFGCNLHCGWCDEHSTDFALLSIKDIEDRIEHAKGGRALLITGGEPSLHIDIAFLSWLSRYSYTSNLIKPILVETNGTVAFSLCQDMYVTLSPKYGHTVNMRTFDALKFVIPGDYPDARCIVEDFKRSYRQTWAERREFGLQAGDVYFQPQWDNDERIRNENFKTTMEWTKCYRELTGYSPKLSLQGHKFYNIA